MKRQFVYFLSNCYMLGVYTTLDSFSLDDTQNLRMKRQLKDSAVELYRNRELHCISQYWNFIQLKHFFTPEGRAMTPKNSIKKRKKCML